MAPRFEYRIHPSVGIARMGNSDTTYFLTAEKPWIPFQPEQRKIPGAIDRIRAGTKIRDQDDLLCKQGARFRVFCYQINRVTKKVEDVWECQSSEYDIEWTAEVANLKASIVDALLGPKVANKPDAVTLKSTQAADIDALKVFAGKRAAAADPDNRLDLGSCFLDSDGRLTVLGSAGAVKRMQGRALMPRNPDSLFWADWEDDAADGPINAKITPKAGSPRPDAGDGQQDALQAWVVVSMPDYGADARATTTLYDLATNHAYERALKHVGQRPVMRGIVTYTQQIQPLYFAQYAVPYTIDAHRNALRIPFDIPAFAPSNSLFKTFLRPAKDTKKIKPEDIWNRDGGEPAPVYSRTGIPTPGSMPDLDYTSVTELQQKAVDQWAAGTLPAGTDAHETSADVKFAPYQLDRAHLESMSGGSFYPGIEVARQAHWYKTWQGRRGCCREHYDVRVTKEVNDAGSVVGPATAGYLTQHLANPWQADFVDCSGRYWPHSRPESVQLDKGAASGWKNWMSSGAGGMASHTAVAGDQATGGFVEHWWKTGFIRYDVAADEMLEKERLVGFGISAAP